MIARLFAPPPPRRFEWGTRVLMALLLATAAGCGYIVLVGFVNPDALAPRPWDHLQVDGGIQIGRSAIGDARQHADCDELHWRQPNAELDQLAAGELAALASVCGRYPAPAKAVR